MRRRHSGVDDETPEESGAHIAASLRKRFVEVVAEDRKKYPYRYTRLEDVPRESRERRWGRVRART